MDIKIRPITNKNWQDTLEIQVSPRQLHFVADHQPVSLVILAKCYVGAGGACWYPFAIENHNQMVGVVVLALKDKKCWIFHLVIDAKYQNKGIGSMAVAVLKTHIQDTWPECESIKITVHPENVVAKKIYSTSGFIDTGDVENSETIMEYKLKGLSN